MSSPDGPDHTDHDADDVGELDLDATADALRALRRHRRRKRVASIHWVDALYRTYVAAVVGIVVVLLVSSFVGDGEVTGSALDRVLADGPAAVGVVVAVALALGLRSGGQGGPLALEAAEVRHVLLAPVPHRTALWHPAVQQLRFAAFVGAVIGAIGGQLAARRLPGSPLAWVAVGGAFGLVLALAALGAALVCSGWHVPRWVTTLVGAGLVGWAVADLTGHAPTAPTSLLGELALAPASFDWVAIPAALATLALVPLGLLAMGGLTVEAAERRAALVGQLRFAATMQDLRTVLVLRRQLAQERPRSRPWVRLRRVGRRLPVWRRDWHGILRFPGTRLARIALLALVGGLSLRAAWDGTTPLLVLAGLAFFVAGMEAAEPLSQEVDHRDRTDVLPTELGDVLVRHLPAAGVVAVLVGGVAAGAAALAGPPAMAVAACAAASVTGALAGVAGGAASVVMGAPEPSSGSETAGLVPPEVAGLKIAARTAWPPAMAVVGCLPLLATRVAEEKGYPAFRPTATACVGVVLLVSITAAWVRFREPARAWFRRQMEEAAQQSGMRPAKEPT
ncbi:MAG: hypothetical protein IPM45_09645 [Acidimicrobiales bacterium]|nr:hypothetical protein [Acidimicrobiales bacterium]